MSSNHPMPILPPSGIVMIGLGAMGVPMARRLIEKGYRVMGVDPAEAGRAALQMAGGEAFTSSAGIDPASVSAVITMLPTGAIVRAALLEGEALAKRLKPGTLVLDMSSSRPSDTVSLEQALAPMALRLVDAPVSGGVKRAIDGTLAVMAGGPEERIAQALPLLEAMGKTIIPTGPIGSGHAMKALNNYVSAAGLVAACEALLVGRNFGLSPETIVDVLNVSTGRNNSTEVKLKPFVISESFASGFGMALMAKDVGIAAELADEMGFDLPQMPRVAELWSRAVDHLGKQADHTEIYRFIAPEKPVA